ncbi:MAG TPA: ATP-binding protein [Candidatus Acidoferrum sp.]|nr:ATP-binding protein [Candidatus Acidoferrum sp.]
MPDPVKRLSPEENLLARFVDRTGEIDKFRLMLDNFERCIMVVWGESGAGKSALQTRLMHECTLRNVKKVRVTSRSLLPLDYMAVMEEIKSGLGAAAFEAFTTLVEASKKRTLDVAVRFEGGAINVGNQAQITGSHIDNMAGVIVNKLEINTGPSEMQELDTERVVKITRSFVECLQRVLQEGPVVLFLDDLEKMSPGTEGWLWSELLCLLRDGTLNNLVAVVCGQRKPTLETDWDDYTEVTEIGNFDQTLILEYLVKRGIAEEYRAGMAFTLFTMTRGKVGEVVKIVSDALQASSKK